MDKEICHSSSSSELLKSEASSSSQLPFSHDLCQMLPKNRTHRRARSEILTLPHRTIFDTDEDFLSLCLDHQSPSVSASASTTDSKRAMSAVNLTELALVDPKRAKRIWANRHSAARSKERKARYISELERKVQTLHTEATSVSTQLIHLQKDTNGLTAENSELKLRLQTVEQQIHVQDALNDALKQEMKHLKGLTGQAILNGGLTGQVMPNGGPLNFTPFSGGQPFYPNNQAMQTLLAAQQLEQLQIHSQKQSHQLQQQHQFPQHQLQQQQQFHQHQLRQQQQQQQQEQ